MAERSVFVSRKTFPFYEDIHVSLEWFGGFALSQKRKCEIGLHENFKAAYPNEKVLEISSASRMFLGARLSAMNLKKRTQRGITSVESAFQSSRIFSDETRRVGPFPEYMFLPGKECKKIVKKESLGMHSHQYNFDDLTFYAPEHHISQFYDFLYLNALLEPENEVVMKELLNCGYTAFSDLATKSLNCQARSAAIFVGLVKAELINEVKDYKTYLKLFRTGIDGREIEPESDEGVPHFINGAYRPLSPVVPCKFGKKEVEAYYAEHCYMLTNRKSEDNYLDIKRNE